MFYTEDLRKIQFQQANTKTSEFLEGTEMNVNSKIFWTFLSFLAFLLFIVAISTKLYWLNIFVIVLGLLVNKQGASTLFPKYLEKKKIARERRNIIRESKRK